MPRKRNKQVKVWLTEEEYQRLINKVHKSKLSQSDYIRKSILEKDIIVIEGIKELLVQIKKIGNNLNQLTKAVNSGIAINPSSDLKYIKQELKEVWQELIKTLKKV